MRKGDSYVLTSEQRAQFLADGFVLLRAAFPREAAEALVPQFWASAPVPKDDPGAWEQPVFVIQRSFGEGPGARLWSDRALAALDDLLGAGRYHAPAGSGWPVVNLPGFHALPWAPPARGWHIDGIHFHHHVNSPEQGLVGLLLFTDVEPGGGGTAVKPGSHRITARILWDAEPDGLELAELCRRVDVATAHLPAIEVVGGAGDILMMHPHLYHASSPNCRSRARIASNFCISLKAPMELRRSGSGDYSLVERAVVDALRG
jgi:hypothetical protein